MAAQSRPCHRNLRSFICLALCILIVGCSSSSDREPPITTPEPFTFEHQREVDHDDWIVSESVTVTGINAPVPVQISEGEFSIDGGTFASTDAAVTAGQTIRVRLRSPEKADQTAEATLTVGSYTTSFSITTAPDTTPPEVTIHFPPPASMTEGDTIFMRGSVRDVHGQIASLRVEGHDVEVELALNEASDEGEWQVTVPLEVGLNTVNLIAEDTEGNSAENTGVRVTQAPITSAFPDNEVPFDRPTGITISENNNGSSAYVVSGDAGPVVEVNLSTGKRTLVSENETHEGVPFEWPMYIVEGARNILYVCDSRGNKIYEIDKLTGQRRTLDLQVIEEFEDTNSYLGSIDYDAERSVLYTVKGADIFAINIATGTIDKIGTTEPLDMTSMIGLAFDQHTQSIFVTNPSSPQIASYSLTDNHINTYNLEKLFIDAPLSPAVGPLAVSNKGSAYILNRRNGGDILLLSDIHNNSEGGKLIGKNHIENQIRGGWDIDFHPNHGYVLLTDFRLRAIIAVDAITGTRVVLSKAETD